MPSQKIIAKKLIAPVEQIESRMFLVRGQKVMLSTHLAELYEVEPRILVRAVKRNFERFPEDFMFQLNPEEFANLKSQIGISSWGGVRTAPYAFTEQGGCNALQRFAQYSSHSGQHRNHAGLCASAPDAVLQRRAFPQAGHTRKEIRHPVQGGF